MIIFSVQGKLVIFSKTFVSLISDITKVKFLYVDSGTSSNESKISGKLLVLNELASGFGLLEEQHPIVKFLNIIKYKL